MPDLEADLVELGARLATPADLAEDYVAAVNARIDRTETGPDRRPRRWISLVAAAAVAVGSWSAFPQVRATAYELLEVVGVSLSTEAPDAPRTPSEQPPSTRLDRLEDVDVTFPVEVSRVLGAPDEIVVTDEGRVLGLTWGAGADALALDQFDGRLSPIFEKQVGGVLIERTRVGRSEAWWIGGPHDLVYVDRSGSEVSATQRLAGRALVWTRPDGVTVRIEGRRLTLERALAIADSLAPAGTS